MDDAGSGVESPAELSRTAATGTRGDALCGQVFGYVEPAVPVMYLNTTPSRSEIVRAAIAHFASTREIMPPPGLRWGPYETVEYVHRVTVWNHEQRHVHDLLATTFGNHLFFAGLAQSLAMLTQLYLRAARGERQIALPLPSKLIQPKGCVAYPQILGSSSKLFEASAVFCQQAVVLRNFPDEAFRALSLSYYRDERYSAAVKELWAVGELLAKDPNLMVHVSRIVLALLCEAPSPHGDKPQEYFSSLLRSLTALPTAAAAAELRSTAISLWNRGLAGLRGVEQSTRPWRELIDYLLRAHTGEMKEAVRAAIDDFMDHARTIREQIVEDASCYSDLGRYLNTPWIDPMVYAYSDGKFPKLWDAHPDGRYMNRDVWQRFVLAIAPALYLATEGMSRTPRTYYDIWLKAQADRFGIEFVSRSVS